MNEPQPIALNEKNFHKVFQSIKWAICEKETSDWLWANVEPIDRAVMRNLTELEKNHGDIKA